MPLSLLSATPGLCAYYDEATDILFLDLQGHLPLATMRVAEKELVQLAAQRSYGQVIISTYHILSLELAAQQRFMRVLAPGLGLLGAQKLAWVCQPVATCIALGHLLLGTLPISACLFNDLEHAASWLPSHPHELAEPTEPAEPAEPTPPATASCTQPLARALRRVLLQGRQLPCYRALALRSAPQLCAV